MDGVRPKCVIEVTIETVFFQCARALLRSKLWSDPGEPTVPSPGAMLAALTDAAIDGAAYDRDLPERQLSTLY
jgi:predicted pyridoxine 5'-phosphate oxidase superfamily flavin-nucleotide-binding protein